MSINTVRISTLVSLLGCMFGPSMSTLGHFCASPYDRVKEDIDAFRKLVSSSFKHVDDIPGCRGDFHYDLPNVDAILKVAQDLNAEDELGKPYVDLDTDDILSPCMDVTPYADAAKNELSLALLNADECIKELRNNPGGVLKSLSTACKFFYIHRDAYNALRDIAASVMRVCEYEKAFPYVEVKSEYSLLTSDNPGRRGIEEGDGEEENANNPSDASPPLGDTDSPQVIEGASSPGEDPPRYPKGGKDSNDGGSRKKRNGKKPIGGGNGGGDDGYDGDDDDGDDENDEQRRKSNAYTLDYYLKNYQFINYRPETSGCSALQMYAAGLTMALVACVM